MQRGKELQLSVGKETAQENTIYQAIFTKAAPQLAKGRWWDLVHTRIAVTHMQEVLGNERKAGGMLALFSPEQYEHVRAVLLPAIILHDIGWGSMEGEDKQRRWVDADMRITHMQVGAETSNQILSEVAYPPVLTTEIVHLVATHDNQYLGQEPTTVLEKIHRDVDAIWIFSRTSFWKDYHHQVLKANQTGTVPRNPEEYLADLLAKHGERYTHTAQVLVEKAVVKRKEEITENLYSNEEQFLRLKARCMQLNTNTSAPYSA